MASIDQTMGETKEAVTSINQTVGETKEKVTSIEKKLNDEEKRIKKLKEKLKKYFVYFMGAVFGICSLSFILFNIHDKRVKKESAWLRNLFLSASEGDGWGDNRGGRSSYSIEDINTGNFNVVTLNSISNGRVGNEKNFVAAKVAGENGNQWNADTITVEDGQTYTICLYINNDNPNGKNALAVAKDVNATVSLPTTVNDEMYVVGYIEASNSDALRYWDTVKLISEEPFYLEYIKGSAKYTNYKKGTIQIDDEVIAKGGVQLGYDNLNGIIPGGYNYSSILTIDVIVHKSVTAKLSMKARLKGTKDWNEIINAAVGDEVEFQIEFVNLLSETVQDVMIRDVLPTNIEYVNDTTYLYNSNFQDGTLLMDNTITTKGINIGGYGPQANAFIRFTGRVVDNSLAEGVNQLVNWVNVTIWANDQEEEQEEESCTVYKTDVSVIVTKESDSKENGTTKKKLSFFESMRQLFQN